MKKTICALLTLCLLFCFTACDKPDTKEPEPVEREITETVPEYSSDKEFMLGMWIGVPSNHKIYDKSTGQLVETKEMSDEEFLGHYRDIAAAGFTVANVGYGDKGREYNLRALNAAKEVGIKQIIQDDDVLSILMDDSRTDERAVRDARNAASYFINHEAFWGLSVRDEPSYDEIPQYKLGQERFAKAFPGKVYYMNLLPIIADKDSITSNYGEYIKQYARNIKEPYMSVDHYVLKNGSRGNYLLQNFVTNLTIMKKSAPDLEGWLIAQSMSFGGTNRALTSVADTNFQAYIALACGFTGISWFCYFSPPPNDGRTSFADAVIDRDHKKTAAYDYVKETNLALQGFSDVYFNFDWKGIICNIGDENDNGGDNADFAMSSASVVTAERIESLKTQQDTVVGVFKDGEGRDGFMFVGYSEPSAGKQNKVSVKFKDCAGAAVYKNGVKSIVKAKDGTIEFTQNAGDGYFVIPLK